ncbi:MAG: hypothetical protein ACYS3S_03555 [Planctomycetota bacterium]
MQTAAMSCTACGVKIEGNFSETFFNRLSPEDQEFLEQYLLAGFSIKTLEQVGQAHSELSGIGKNGCPEKGRLRATA